MKTRILRSLAALAACFVTWGCQTDTSATKPTTSRDLFVLPKGTNSVLCRMDSGIIRELVDLPFPAFQHVAFGTNVEMATLGPNQSTVLLAQYAPSHGLSPVATIPLPTNFTANCVRFVAGELYVGGGGWRQSERLGFLTAKNRYQWHNVHVPTALTRYGKAIDELLLDGTRLIAVDNVVRPKWSLIYDVSDPMHPVFLSSPELDDFGRVFAAALGEHWIATLSTSFGPKEYLVIYERKTMEPKARLLVPLGWSPEPDGKPAHPHESQHWLDIAFLDDLLLLPACEHGLACMDLNKIKQSKDQVNVLFNNLKYLPLPDTPEAKVLDVVTCPASGSAIVITRWGDELRRQSFTKKELVSLCESPQTTPFDPIDMNQFGMCHVFRRNIKLPGVDFRQAHIRDIAEFLSDCATRLSHYDSFGDKPDPLEIRVDVPAPDQVPLITLSITNDVCLEAVVHEVCKQANLSYTYSTNSIRLHNKTRSRRDSQDR